MNSIEYEMSHGLVKVEGLPRADYHFLAKDTIWLKFWSMRWQKRERGVLLGKVFFSNKKKGMSVRRPWSFLPAWGQVPMDLLGPWGNTWLTHWEGDGTSWILYNVVECWTSSGTSYMRKTHSCCINHFLKNWFLLQAAENTLTKICGPYQTLIA